MKFNRDLNKTEQEKKLVKLYKEYLQITKEISLIPYIELKKPIFYSFGIQWSINIQSSKYMNEYKLILEKYTKVKRIKNIKSSQNVYPDVIKLNKKQYYDFVQLYPDALRWFIKSKTKDRKVEYIFNKMNILKKEIVKIMITHLKDINPNLESRKKEIQKTLFENIENKGKIDNLKGIKNKWKEDDVKRKYKLIQILFPTEISNY